MKNTIRELSLQEIDTVAGGDTGHYTDGWNTLPPEPLPQPPPPPPMPPFPPPPRPGPYPDEDPT